MYMEEKKTIIINEKEFETYSPLTSNILECASYADRIRNADSLGLVTKYFSFLMKWRWAIIVFMPFALLMNGGITCDIILGIVLIISYIWGNHYSECSKILIQLNFLGANSYSWDSFEAANNTLKEANYLIPKLKECEKQTEETKRWEMYLELVKEMDKKYGERKHMLGRPYTKEEGKKDKEKAEIIETKNEAKECAIKDVVSFFKGVNELYKKAWDEYEKGSVHLLSALFDLDMFLRKRHDNSCRTLHERHRFNFINRPSDNVFNTFDEDYQSIYDTIVGDPYHYLFSFKCGLASLFYVHAKRIFEDQDYTYPYYNENDLDACLEGKMVFEIIQEINKYPEIKETFDEMEVFPKITNEMYQMMCKRVEEINYTIDDLKERMR